MSGWPQVNVEIVPEVAAASNGTYPLATKDEVKALASPRMKLETLRDLKKEYKRIYVQARLGKIALADATRFAYLISCMARLINESEIEKRVEALESSKG